MFKYLQKVLEKVFQVIKNGIILVEDLCLMDVKIIDNQALLALVPLQEEFFLVKKWLED
mgnify:CR=1 FL=1